jgi:DNA sulfur modification protein DndD
MIVINSFSLRNYRAFRALDLSFSRDPSKSLTVIRAENESGKTTLLNALTWTLFGDDSLPGRRDAYRMSPIDWAPDEGNDVQIDAEIEISLSDESAAAFGTSAVDIRIHRETVETVTASDEFNRRRSGLTLWQTTPVGDEQVSEPETILSQIFPPYLKDVFFTDGDRALTFIDPAISSGERSSRVENSIRSLLGLDLLSNAKAHLQQVGRELNAAAGSAVQAQGLQELVDRIERSDQELQDLQTQLSQSQSEGDEASANLADIQSRLDSALIRGDREQLVNDLNLAQRQYANILREMDELRTELSAGFDGSGYSFGLLQPLFERSTSAIAELYDRGTIPRNFLPILEERVEMEECVCGAPLTVGSSGLTHIQEVIEEERRRSQSVAAERLTQLQHSHRSRGETRHPSIDWLNNLAAARRQIGLREVSMTEVGRRIRNLESEIAEVQDSQVQELRVARASLQGQIRSSHQNVGRAHASIEEKTRVLSQLEAERHRIASQEEAGRRAVARLEATQDLQTLIDRSVDVIRNEKVKQVSDVMDDLFIRMIRSDPDAGIIRNATISNNFEIQVSGPENRSLNPGTDLNGASKRALTYAFILSLTAAADFEAPAFIDTPLGMTSGVVRKNIVQVTSDTGRPVMLLLTRIEIAGVEELLDQHGGSFSTLTNLTQDDVINRDIENSLIVSCVCNHRQYCNVCERRGDESDQSLTRRV